MTDTLFTYRCRSCKTIAIASYQATRSGNCVRCNLCRSPMIYLWDEPVVTEEQRALWQQGTVYNPAQWLEDRQKAKETA